MAELPQSAEKTERLRVVVRCRPPSTVEEKLPCVLLDEAAAQVVVQRTDRAEQPLLFTFDGVLGADSTQEQAGSLPCLKGCSSTDSKRMQGLPGMCAILRVCLELLALHDAVR